MKTLATFLLSTLMLILLQSCNNYSGEYQARLIDGYSDNVLSAFHELEALQTSGDSLAAWQDLDGNYYFHQRYRMQGDDQLFSGTLHNYHWQDTLRYEGVLENGKIKRLTQWYPNGQKQREVTLTGTTEDSFETVIKSWYYSGEIQGRRDREKGITYYKSGAVKSEWDTAGIMQYWENGNPQVFFPGDRRKMGASNGIQEMWHENGRLGARGELVNSKREGEWQFYDSTGTPAKTEIYRGGDLDTTIIRS